MVIQWPDRFYHTSADTPDRVDPQMLARVGRLAAVYAYWIAQAGRKEAQWLAREMSARFRQRIIGALQEAVTRAGDEEGEGRETVRQRLDYWIERHQEGLRSLRRLAPISVSTWEAQDAEFAHSEWAHVADLLPDRATVDRPKVEGGEAVVRRRFRGPAQVEGAVARQDAATRDRWWRLRQSFRKTASVLPVLAQYWADGRRTVAEIAERVQLETDHEVTERLVEYFGLLAELEVVDLRV